uniref:Zgc:136439 n=1 Tax=Kryptolebias marmoratus TaxID=37003 RepID=A0A3Q3AXM4_KRYMA
MKAVILAAGYGTRLQRDVRSDSTGRFAHLAGVPKPLLPVGRCALISHWVRALTASGFVDRIYVVTNALYRAAFEEWAAGFINVQILSDQTRSNEERLGAVACLQLAVKHFNIQEHVVVIGGDTLFLEDFSLGDMERRFSDVQRKCAGGCLVLAYTCRDEETKKYGILEVDEDGRVVCMKEKPDPSETESRRAVSPETRSESDAPVDERDAPGNFVSWLIQRKPVYAHQISGRFDVGNLPSYVECDRYFRERLHDAASYML